MDRITSLFLLVVCGSLYLANAVVYEALAVMFDIQSGAVLLSIGLGLGMLSASLITSTIIGSYFYNWMTRWYYRVSAVWIGLFVYLFFASLLYGFAVMVSGQLVPSVGMALVSIALTLSLYGIFHARQIVVKEVGLALPNLPAVWRGRRAVFISDLHLGQLHGPAFARRVVRTVNTVPHDIIFIGGDLYDGTGAPDIGEMAASFKDFSAQLGTYFITGNHEEFGDNSHFLAAIRGAGITTLVDEMVSIDGLQILGVDYKHASDKKRFRAILAGLNIDKTRPSILLKHEPKDLDVARDAGISLQISGHTHLGQMWPLGLIARLVYKGFAYGLKPLGPMQVYTSSGVGTWGPPMRVGTQSEIVVLVF